MIKPINGRLTREDKLNVLIKVLKNPPDKGPFTDSFSMDLLQYMLDHYYRIEDGVEKAGYKVYDPILDPVSNTDKFSYKYSSLINALKRDGYTLQKNQIKKMLPSEIEEARIESDLVLSLKQSNFYESLGHLEQAISNHSQGNWAGANAQFRAFIESLLISISKKLLPANKCDSASSAINLLTNSVSPSFLSKELNEVESDKCKKPFIEGFWKRLHPAGAHPGLSSDEDSTFRYHMTIVVAYNLVRRLRERE
ncbi:MAG: hypothetical protein K2Y12_03330 [Chitinophagaceae bacterium]|nr:hypothetical protein [Chitinophagaceae bacterium]